MQVIIISAAFLAVMALIQNAHAGAECASLGGGCDDSGWSGAAKLDEIGNPTVNQEQTSAKWPAKSREMRWNMSASTAATKKAEAVTAENAQNATTAREKAQEEQAVIVRSDDARIVLAPLDSVSDKDILLDVSENSSTHIAGSVVIPYMVFDEEAGVLKPAEEITKTLGDAGISREDSVVVYGECLPCGGGPSVATFVYWMMLGLGQEKVRVLDGTAADWAASGQEVALRGEVLPARIYTALPTANYTATYDQVKSGQVQIVDARTRQEYGTASIPGAISIPYASVLDKDRIKDEEELKKVFMLLDKDKPVAVFTNTGMKASVVWFTLSMMGYDALLYSYKDWVSHQNHASNAGNQ